MPLPQLVDFSVWPTMKGGTRNQRQIDSTLNARVSSSCASFGLMPTISISVPPSSTTDLPALTLPEIRRSDSRASSR